MPSKSININMNVSQLMTLMSFSRLKSECIPSLHARIFVPQLTVVHLCDEKIFVTVACHKMTVCCIFVPQLTVVHLCAEQIFVPVASHRISAYLTPLLVRQKSLCITCYEGLEISLEHPECTRFGGTFEGVDLNHESISLSPVQISFMIDNHLHLHLVRI